MSSSALVNVADLEHRIRRLGPWFHNMNLGGVQTAPEHFLGDYPAVKWRHFADAVPQDLAGLSVLDIGCNAGFYSMQMASRGAARVVAMDSDADYLAQARVAAEVLGYPQIEFVQLNVYDVAKLARRSMSCCSWACSTTCGTRCWRST